jgi:predicted nucleic acid-binding Zn finger protein
MCKCSDFADDANLDGCAFVEGAEAALQKGDFVFQ